ncbi:MULTISPECIES: DUF2285 domain-containing protein [Pseudomonadota]|jgi:hypothetical protein|uniref:DUF2285 domain-containing protein n=2 Tax=Burkholderiales TaxID=80840 RepID=A0ABM6E488_9BURK|nr:MULTISPECIES: DUF2285 domain-containing protein [Burkholderiales]MBN8745884.1 DUF2285 domain-containing protein [Variovorax sp.]HCE6346750.1 DUF2285 domain-containing protein [Pseudomonas aeruginosa]AOV02307.1 hypothetical protein BI380_13675 [Delftia tsuruhatensis]OEZ27797.1 hypothetical protein AO062_26200 [Variovorax boronicumulans]VBB10806.1 Uncharacterized conserved protein,Uncharacterized conserved protein (DUF2285) [Burkholderia stabilis]
MVSPHHFAHWYPTAAYLYVLWLDALALAWEYLRRNPDYRLDWLRRARRPDAAQRWGLRLLEDPALDARDAHPAWLPGHADVVQLYPDADPPPDAAAFAFWSLPGHKQLLHDGKGLVLIARSPGRCLRYALAPGLEDGMAVAYAQRGGAAAPALGHAPSAVQTRPRPTPAALLELHTLQALDATLTGASLRDVAEGLFGADAVAADWHADGDLRARVRRLVRRGDALMRGGYRQLAQLPSLEKGRFEGHAKRP